MENYKQGVQIYIFRRDIIYTFKVFIPNFLKMREGNACSPPSSKCGSTTNDIDEYFLNS